jgi:hypothetical protein
VQHEYVYTFLSITAKSLTGYFLLSGMLASSSAAHYGTASPLPPPAPPRPPLG